MGRSSENESTESILRGLRGGGIHLYMLNPLIEPAYLNINTKLNIFSLGASLTRKRFLVRVQKGLTLSIFINIFPGVISTGQIVISFILMLIYLSRNSGRWPMIVK